MSLGLQNNNSTTILILLVSNLSNELITFFKRNLSSLGNPHALPVYWIYKPIIYITMIKFLGGVVHNVPLSTQYHHTLVVVISKGCLLCFFVTHRAVKTGNPTRPGSTHHGLMI